MTRAATALFAIGTMTAALLLAGPGAAAESAGQSRFDQFPSKPGEQIDLIKRLPDGTWLDLGPPAPDPKWGVARGRSWTSTMPLAGSMQIAFLYGEGNHGWWNEKTGHYMDDLWAYDIMANRWVNIYPGTDVRNPPKLILNQDGFPALENGDPIPIATPVHGYEMSTWDPEHKNFLAMEAYDSFFDKPMPSVLAFFRSVGRRLNDNHASPWIYDTRANKWRRHATETPSPDSGVGTTFIYVPSIKKVFYRRHDVWFYDPATNRWQQVTPKGPWTPFGIDATACYDSKRDRIYIGGGAYPVTKGPNALWIYDVRSNTWIDPQPKGSPGVNGYGTNRASMHYDSVSDTVLLFRYGDDGVGIFAYSPDKNEWTTVSDHLPARWYPDSRSSGVSGFYDPELNAHFFFVAGDSRDNGTMMVYRYKNPQ